MFTSRHPQICRQICRQIDRFVRTCFIWTPCWVPLLGALLGTEPSTWPPPQRLMQWALGPHGQRSPATAGSEPLMLWSLGSRGSRCWSLEVGSRWYIYVYLRIVRSCWLCWWYIYVYLRIVRSSWLCWLCWLCWLEVNYYVIIWFLEVLWGA